MHQPKHIAPLIPKFGYIDSVKCNATGSHVAIIVKTVRAHSTFPYTLYIRILLFSVFTCSLLYSYCTHQ